MYYLDSIIKTLFNIYYFIIIIYIFSSWVPQARQSQLGFVLGKIVEPYLKIFKQFIPPLGMIDISPIIALFALSFIEEGVLIVIRLIGGY